MRAPLLASLFQQQRGTRRARMLITRPPTRGLAAQRAAVCHPEFQDDLQHWIDTDRRGGRRTAKRLLDVMRAVPLMKRFCAANRFTR